MSAGTLTGRGTRRPYSLGRTQHASWFTVAVLACVLVGLAMDELDSLSQPTSC